MKKITKVIPILFLVAIMLAGCSTSPNATQQIEKVGNLTTFTVNVGQDITDWTVLSSISPIQEEGKTGYILTVEHMSYTSSDSPSQSFSYRIVKEDQVIYFTNTETAIINKIDMDNNQIEVTMKTP